MPLKRKLSGAEVKKKKAGRLLSEDSASCRNIQQFFLVPPMSDSTPAPSSKSAPPVSDSTPAPSSNSAPPVSDNNPTLTSNLVTLGNIVDIFQPNQPSDLNFPSRDFGNRKRSFMPIWFKQYKWLHYSESEDKAYCCICITAKQRGLKTENSFTNDGYCNWKNAMESKKGFAKHASSKYHTEAIKALISIPATTRNISDMLSSEYAQKKRENAAVLMKLLSTIQYLGRQGLALRGDGTNDNYLQLLTLRSEDDQRLKTWLQKNKAKYTSHEVQNEMLLLMANEVLRNVVDDIKSSPFFSIMADETADISNTEQLVFCIRWVDDNFCGHEEFIGLHSIASTDAETLTNAIKDILIRLDLPMQNCRGQCYDGASSMTGKKTGVVTQMKKIEPRCLFIHCYGHALNLACSDSVKACKLMKDVLSSAFEITKLIKLSPKREAQLKKISDLEYSEEVSPKLRLLCTTRWTIRGLTLDAIIRNYAALQQLWDWALENSKEADMRARILGVQTEMKSFRFFFGLHVAQTLFLTCDNLSKALQSQALSAAEGQVIAKRTVSTLQGMRDKFDLLWGKVAHLAKNHDVLPPKLPRQKRVPSRFELGTAPPEFPEGVEELYRRDYIEAVDLLINCIRDRFDQEDYNTYCACEQLLLQSSKGLPIDENIFSALINFFQDDFEPSLLRTQLNIFSSYFVISETDLQNLSLDDVLKVLRTFGPSEKLLLSEVVKLAKLLIVMPATNATSERSFSTLRRVKTYLRSSMTQSRLNHIMILNVHLQKVDSIDLKSIARQFVCKSDQRLSKFELSSFD